MSYISQHSDVIQQQSPSRGRTFYEDVTKAHAEQMQIKPDLKRRLVLPVVRLRIRQYGLIPVQRFIRELPRCRCQKDEP